MTANWNGGPPDPGTPATPAELTEKLRELRGWAGQPSLRRLRGLGGTRLAVDGDEVDALPESTVSYVLRGTRPASAELVHSFVTACLRARHLGQEEVAGQVERWHEAWLVATRHATADREPDAPAAAPRPAPRAIPQQLPRDAAWFTGRATELERLLALVPDPQRATAVVISAIDGMAGIGKTKTRM